MKIKVERLEEVKSMLGLKLLVFEILEGKESDLEEPYCAEQEILMYFEGGKEMRIYIDEERNLCVYTD